MSDARRNLSAVFMKSLVLSLGSVLFRALTLHTVYRFFWNFGSCIKIQWGNILFFPNSPIKCWGKWNACTINWLHINLFCYHPSQHTIHVWSDFDRASSLMCGNKMPTRCNRWFYCRSYCLLNTFQAPLCPSSGAREYYTDGRCLWYLVFWFSSCRYGVELRVMCPVCGLLQQQPANRKLKTKTPNTTGSDHLYNTLELLMMGIMMLETCWAGNKICNKNHLLHLIGVLLPHTIHSHPIYL